MTRRSAMLAQRSMIAIARRAFRRALASDLQPEELGCNENGKRQNHAPKSASLAECLCIEQPQHFVGIAHHANTAAARQHPGTRSSALTCSHRNSGLRARSLRIRTVLKQKRETTMPPHIPVCYNS
jgi:hypothetical protein